MKTALVFDLETTGLPTEVSIYNLQAYDSCRIVQFCWTFLDMDSMSSVVSIKNRFILPQDHIVLDDMFCAKYGMTHNKLTELGVPLRDVIRELRLDILQWQPGWVMGHNVEFDVLCLMSEIYRLYEDMNRPYEFFKLKDESYPRVFCTYVLSSILREQDVAPYSKMKILKLGYMYKFLTDNTLQGAHTADADVLACIDIAKHLWKVAKVRNAVDQLQPNYDKGLLLTTQNKKEWLQLL